MFQTRTLLLAALSLGLTAVSAGAATLAQYTFEENPAGTSTTTAGTQLLDSSGNNLHFTKNGAPGTLSWSSDVSSVQPVGSTSLQYNAANMLDTPDTDLSFATNPQLTIEFWYKPNLGDTIRYLLDTGDGNNTWGLTQAVPATDGTPSGQFHLEFFHVDNAGTFRVINTDTTFSTTLSNNDWTHVGVVIDRIAGDIAIYFDGVEDTATAGVDENIDSFTYAAKADDGLRLGSVNTGGGFANNVFLDDLRLSDVALEAGDGTGVGELAWNATLIPEPGSMALLGLGGAALMLGRRRDTAA